MWSLSMIAWLAGFGALAAVLASVITYAALYDGGWIVDRKSNRPPIAAPARVDHAGRKLTIQDGALWVWAWSDRDQDLRQFRVMRRATVIDHDTAKINDNADIAEWFTDYRRKA